MVTRMQGAGVYVAFATAPDGGLVSLVVDDDVLDFAQAAADGASDCPQPCVCPPWTQFAGEKADPSE